jgi:hypothetical protein
LNRAILSDAVQAYLKAHATQDPRSFALKASPFPEVTASELAQQLASRQKCKDKLPTWHKTANLYYPPSLNLEQTSSEITAQYKSNLVSGKHLVDITGGFGIDAHYFSQQMDQVTHCERDALLSEMAQHNAAILERDNIAFKAQNGLDWLTEQQSTLDWIYVDPSRRSDRKGKVFLLEDCQPDVIENLELFFLKSDHILIKTAPLLDLEQGLKSLVQVSEIHIVGVKNEVKELLWLLKKGHTNSPKITAVNLLPGRGIQITQIPWGAEATTQSPYSLPQQYLYEPNASLMKSGAFQWIGWKFGLKKLAQHSHLYTSDSLKIFPGRRFEIVDKFEYNKATMKTLGMAKANISTRNFPLDVATLRKKHKIKDGGQHYLFFTQDQAGKKWVLACQKA